MATSDSMSAIRKELVNSQRVIVVINSNDYNKYKPMLEKLPDSLPVVYVYLMPLKTMSDMEVCWKKQQQLCWDIRMSLKFSVRWQM